jgi:signal transduction histidine kinase/FixJ family two-component response regulator
MSIPLRVLVIEDSEDDMLLQLRELRRGGYEPSYHRVQSAAELRAALLQPDWQLILADYALPGFTGLDALRLVQQSGLDVPFILISGTVGEEIAVQSMRAGAHDYLLKDSLTRLVPAVNRELREAAERRRRRAAEAALRESQSLLALIQDHAVEMYLLFAADAAGVYRVASVNRAWLAFAARVGVACTERQAQELPREEILRRVLRCSSDEAHQIEARWNRAASRGQPVRFEQQWQRGSEILFIEQQFIPVVDSEGKSHHLLWASRDVTERKRGEDQQRRLEVQLAHAQKLQVLGTMASGIAHDFNNILAGISRYLEMMLQADVRNPPNVQETLQLILQGVHRGTDLARRILEFSRKRAVMRKPMLPGPVVQEVLSFLRPLIPPNVVVKVPLPAEQPMMLADAGQFHQVLLNLCTNALQAMNGCGGTLTVTLEPVKVTPAFARAPRLQPGDYVRLTVSDTGCGMDDATLARLFEPFFTTRAAGMGTGLGLAVVQDVVNNHQGAIAVSSAIGKGSSFELYFPQPGGSSAGGESPATEQAPVVRSGAASGHGERILFVDDEEYLAQMGVALLARLGYRVSAFTDPEQAWAAFAAEPGAFAALVTDLTMPGLKGTDLASRIRQVRPDLPVILTTGYSGPHEVARASSLGFHRLLEKPFTVEKFSNLLERALDKEEKQ